MNNDVFGERATNFKDSGELIEVISNAVLQSSYVHKGKFSVIQ